MASFSWCCSAAGSELLMKQQRFVNQKLGKRISRKSELQRAKLETTRSLARPINRKPQ
jgi:hypothetical protein